MIVFLTAGIEGVAGCVYYGFHDPQSELFPMRFFSIFLGGAFYIVGVIIYGFHFPEVVWPGKFDIFGQSHNLFHFFVVFGAFTHLYSTVTAFQER